MNQKNNMFFNVTAFALTMGLVWGFLIFMLTWWFIAFEGVTNEPTIIGRLYRGYNISPVGSLIGLVWGVADGFFIGAIFAWLYNLLSNRFSKEGKDDE
jgi:hypothetical protein